VQSFIEQIGSATAPLIAGIIADRTSLGNSILLICTVAWVICCGFYLLVARFIPKDMADLQKKLAERASGKGPAPEGA